METEETDPSGTWMHTLRYYVDKPTSSIVYAGVSGSEQVNGAGPLWTITLSVPPGFFASIKAQKSVGDASTIECLIEVDRVAWQRAQANGPYAVVECSGVLDFRDHETC